MLREIAPNIVVETEYHGANVASVATGEGVILIDTPMLPEEALHWRTVIQEADGQGGRPYPQHRSPPRPRRRQPVLPHSRGCCRRARLERDKSYGDSFRTRLLNMYRDRMPEAVAEWQEHLEIIHPEITFTGRPVFLKGKEIHLVPLGGHTPATTVVFIPQDWLLFTGDPVVTNRPPFLSQGDTKEWLPALTYLRKLDYEVLFPVHGELTGKEATEKCPVFCGWSAGRCGAPIALVCPRPAPPAALPT